MQVSAVLCQRPETPTRRLRGEEEEESLCGGDHSLHHRLSVQVRGPVDQVEGSEQDGENYPRHLVDLADAVVGLLGVHHLGLGGPELHGRGVGDGGDGRVLGEVGGVVDARRADVVGLFGQHHGVAFLQQNRRDGAVSPSRRPLAVPHTLTHPSPELSAFIYPKPFWGKHGSRWR